MKIGLAFRVAHVAGTKETAIDVFLFSASSIHDEGLTPWRR